jgi:hypothetical protein
MVKNFIKENSMLKTALVVLPILASTAPIAHAMDLKPTADVVKGTRSTPVKVRIPTPMPSPLKGYDDAAKLLAALEQQEFKNKLSYRQRGLSAPQKRVTPSVENITSQVQHKDDAAVPYSTTPKPSPVKRPLSAKNASDDNR